MSVLDLFEGYGRIFAVSDVGRKGYFDFYEIYVDKKKNIRVKNLKISVFSNSARAIWSEDLTVEELEDLLRGYSSDEIISLRSDFRDVASYREIYSIGCYIANAVVRGDNSPEIFLKNDRLISVCRKISSRRFFL